MEFQCSIHICQHGRHTLSKTTKTNSGKPFGQSLCGLCMLNHFVSQKREEMEVLSPEEISAWYFSDSDDEYMSDSDDEDIYNKCNFNALLLVHFNSQNLIDKLYKPVSLLILQLNYKNMYF